MGSGFVKPTETPALEIQAQLQAQCSAGPSAVRTHCFQPRRSASPLWGLVDREQVGAGKLGAAAALWGSGEPREAAWEVGPFRIIPGEDMTKMSGGKEPAPWKALLLQKGSWRLESSKHR